MHRQAAGVEVALAERAGQAAGQSAPALAVEQQEHAQQHRPRLQPVRRQAGRERGAERHRGDEIGGRGLDAAGEIGPFRRTRRRRDGCSHPVERGTDAPRLQRRHDAGIGGLVAEPKRLHAGQRQLLAEQPARETRQHRRPHRRLDAARAGIVDDPHVAGAGGVEQSGDAEARRRLEFERVERAPVLAAQQHVHALQSLQRLEEQDAVAHRQVAALDQRAGQFAGEHDVLEPELVVGAGGEQGESGPLGASRGEALQRVLPGVEERSEAPRRVGAEQFRERAREGAAVLQHVGDAGRVRGAVGDDAPLPVGPAHDLGGIGVQPLAWSAVERAAGAQEGGVGEHQRRRHAAFGKQALRTVDIAQRRLDQPRPLRQPGLDPLELRHPQQQRQRIAAPGDRFDAGEQGGDPVVDEHALQQLRPAG